MSPPCLLNMEPCAEKGKKGFPGPVQRSPRAKTQRSPGSDGTPSTSSHTPKRRSWADLSEDLESDEDLDFGLGPPPAIASGATLENPFPTLVDQADFQGIQRGQHSHIPHMAWKAIDAATPSDDEQQWLCERSSSSTAQVPEDDLPFSIGSQLHGTGNCRPCIFFVKQVGCMNGKNCEFCHLRHPPRVRHRRHRKKVSKSQESSLGAMAESEGEDDALAASVESSAQSSQDSRSLSRCADPDSQAPLDTPPQRRLKPECSTGNSSSSREPEPSLPSHSGTEVDQKISETLTGLFWGLFRSGKKDQESNKNISSSVISKAPPVVSWRAVEAETPSDDERLWLGAAHGSAVSSQGISLSRRKSRTNG